MSDEVKCWHVNSGRPPYDLLYCTTGEHAPKPFSGEPAAKPVISERDRIAKSVMVEVCDLLTAADREKSDLTFRSENLFAEQSERLKRRLGLPEIGPMVLGRRVVIESRVECPSGWVETSSPVVKRHKPSAVGFQAAAEAYTSVRRTLGSEGEALVAAIKAYERAEAEFDDSVFRARV